MDTTNPIEERRTLTEHFSRLNDAALQAAAGKAYELTEMARSVLRSEIQSRRLDIPLKNTYEPPLGDVDPSEMELDLIPVQQVWGREGASRIKDILDAAGIPSYFGPHNFERADELTVVSDNAVDVKVRGVDQQRAIRALREGLPPRPAPEKGNNECNFVCPQCKSPEIVFCGLDGARDGAAPDAQFNWRCDACGHQWKDDGVEQQRL